MSLGGKSRKKMELIVSRAVSAEVTDRKITNLREIFGRMTDPVTLRMIAAATLVDIAVNSENEALRMQAAVKIAEMPHVGMYRETGKQEAPQGMDAEEARRILVSRLKEILHPKEVEIPAGEIQKLEEEVREYREEGAAPPSTPAEGIE